MTFAGSKSSSCSTFSMSMVRPLGDDAEIRDVPAIALEEIGDLEFVFGDDVESEMVLPTTFFSLFGTLSLEVSLPDSRTNTKGEKLVVGEKSGSKVAESGKLIFFF